MALASLQQSACAAAGTLVHTVRRDSRFAGTFPLTLEMLLARAAADVIPREHLVHRTLTGCIELWIESAVAERLHPLVKVEALIPAVHLAAALPLWLYGWLAVSDGADTR